jgi:hypothetical protein
MTPATSSRQAPDELQPESIERVPADATAPFSPAARSAMAYVLGVQRGVGNAAVARMFARNGDADAPPAPAGSGAPAAPLPRVDFGFLMGDASYQ